MWKMSAIDSIQQSMLKPDLKLPHVLISSIFLKLKKIIFKISNSYLVALHFRHNIRC